MRISELYRTWTPILDGSEKDLFIKKIREIADSAYTLNYEPIGLMQGKSGAALFFYYYYLFTQDPKYLTKAQDLIYASYEEVNNGFSRPSFAAGIAGLLYTTNFLINRGVIPEQKEEIVLPLYPYLFDTSLQLLSIEQNFDFLHGALGAALVFLDDPLANKEKIMFLRDELERISIQDEIGGITWSSLIYISRTEQKRVYNFGLAHGIPSVICFLARCYSVYRDEKSGRLLKGCVKYLLRNQQDFNAIGSYFPYHQDPEHVSVQKSRMGWCYGDLGVALSLYQAGVALQEQEWTEKATEIFRFSANRKFQVYDACLCHGTAGIAHLFARAYQYTGLECLKEAACANYHHALQMLHHPDGYAGYKNYNQTEGWSNNAGLLEGVTGVGLSFLSGVSDLAPDWDSCLLIS